MSDQERPYEQSRARTLWRALEPIHGLTYFAPESQEATTALGTEGYWASYFALRAAPLGPASAEEVTQIFHVFHPGLVARAIPRVWDFASAEHYQELRRSATDRAMHRLVGADALGRPEITEAAELARELAVSAPTEGLPLGAANQTMAWPEPPHLVLWQAQTVLREHRGDGHIAALRAADLDGCQSMALFALDLGLDVDWIRPRRGWSEQEWRAAVDQLTERGLLAGSELTEAGRALRNTVETQTDAEADRVLAAAGLDEAQADARVSRLAELTGPLVDALIAAGGFPVRNPMGLKPLSAGG